MSIFGQGKPGVVRIDKNVGSRRRWNYKGTPMTYEMYELFLARDKIKADYAEYMKRTIANIKAVNAKIVKQAKSEGLDMSEFDRP